VQVDDEAIGKSLHSMKKVLRKKYFYSTRSNQLFSTPDFPCLYMKKKQSSLRNMLEELTSDSDCGALDQISCSSTSREGRTAVKKKKKNNFFA